MESASLILEGGNSSFNPFEISSDQMDLFDLTDLYMSSDLPDFITSSGQEPSPLPNNASSQEFSPSPDSSPVPSPPSTFQLCAQDDNTIKNEPLSPGQASDSGDGSSGDEACYIDLARVSPAVKSELFPAFVNPASLDVKFCNERANPALASSVQRVAPPRRTLKRRREATIKPTISPDQLYPGNIEAKQLSPEEERELKKQKRLIKNRESAQKSRQRRKAYIEELEQKVAVLTAQGEQLAQENKVLKEDITYLLNVLKKTPGVPSEVLSKTSSLGATPIRGVKAAGVCLLIVLFSFGLFFNAKNGPTGPSLPFDPNTPREPIPEVLPTNHYDKKYPTRMLKSLKDAEFDERRDLLEIFPERSRGRRSITIKEEKVQPVEEQVVPSTTQQVPLDTVIKKERYHDDRPSPSARETPCLKKQKKSGNWTKTPVAMDISEEEGSLVPVRDRSNYTSYFFCSDAKEVMAQDGEVSPQQPRTVSLLVPLEAFNGTAAGQGPLSQHLQNHDPSSPAIVEVACQVINMNVFTAASDSNSNAVSVI